MNSPAVRWAELLPDDFRDRLLTCPIVYLPVGLCEPHGHVAAFGLDTIKADFLCDEAARRFGGIVAPTQGYHIHESGYHARWLEDVVGEENPRLGGLPPHVFCHQFLYQLRCFANAGFQAVIVISGHSGGNQEDLRRVAAAFESAFALPVRVQTDPELVAGTHAGDHAGKYEISQLLYLRPELVDLSRLSRQHEPGSSGRLALGDDAGEATAALGERIIEDCLNRIGEMAADLARREFVLRQRIDYAAIEELWRPLLADVASWKTASKHPDQLDVSALSQWKPYETFPSR